jgi:hypothetical protein
MQNQFLPLPKKKIHLLQMGQVRLVMVITKGTEEVMVNKMDMELGITLKEQVVTRTDPKVMAMMSTKAWVKTVMDIACKMLTLTATTTVVTMAAFSMPLKTNRTHNLIQITQFQRQKKKLQTQKQKPALIQRPRNLLV